MDESSEDSIYAGAHLPLVHFFRMRLPLNISSRLMMGETLDEIVPYPIVFEPYPGDTSGTPRLNVVLYDCDGRIANELLAQRQSIERNVKAGGLA